MIKRTLGKAKKTVLYFVFLTVGNNLFAQDEGEFIFCKMQTGNKYRIKPKQNINLYSLTVLRPEVVSPCKWMDKNVYLNGTVGNYMNREFISVKVQMDSTDHDNNSTKSWYKDAQWFNWNYKVDSYPSFLFFSPDGKIQYKRKGARDIKKFCNYG